MTTADAYSAIVQQVRDEPRSRWQEIAARAVAQLVGSGQLTQEQAGDVQRMLSQRLTRLVDAAERERREHLDKLAEAKREYRRLIANGGAVLNGLPVSDIDALGEALIALEWLDEDKSEDRKALLAAIGAALDDIAKPYRRAKSCLDRTDKRRKPRL